MTITSFVLCWSIARAMLRTCTPHRRARTRTPRPTPHLVPAPAPGRTTLPTDRRTDPQPQCPAHSQSGAPRRQRQARSMGRSPRSCAARMIRFGIVNDQASSSQISRVLIVRNSTVSVPGVFHYPPVLIKTSDSVTIQSFFVETF
ncbi:hypothetical protein JB92DRAFT_251258 [Gautieria morchelliformis]|nr:hypothetical protein JB92DRAFT_251258 [Gautieria morchelliformis]